MPGENEKRFQDFFEEGKYVLLKNYLYNYRLRIRAIHKRLKPSDAPLLLEIGSGLSPILKPSAQVVYSELSFVGLRTLKRSQRGGHYVVADGTRLPFRDGAFTNTIASEVLEHIPDDRAVLRELARVLRPEGQAIVTVPHRMMYYTSDDRFVKHCRRYEIAEMRDKMTAAGLHDVHEHKVLGPLEKVLMLTAVFLVSRMPGFRSPSERRTESGRNLRIVAPLFDWINRALMCVAWLDARIAPKSLAAVILFRAERPRG